MESKFGNTIIECYDVESKECVTIGFKCLSFNVHRKGSQTRRTVRYMNFKWLELSNTALVLIEEETQLCRVSFKDEVQLRKSTERLRQLREECLKAELLRLAKYNTSLQQFLHNQPAKPLN